MFDKKADLSRDDSSSASRTPARSSWALSGLGDITDGAAKTARIAVRVAYRRDRNLDPEGRDALAHQQYAILATAGCRRDSQCSRQSSFGDALATAGATISSSSS